ncbi:MAG: adenylate/guanylate cyclase domain-containing protein [Gammaproteobacteria bacterium]|nr:adenylate/guanylate cyclase domain-containing protein [Gammaproteobacteria bacterium]
MGWMDLRFVQQLENQAYDTRLRLTAPETVDDRIVVVDIDQRSLQRQGRFPWPRARMAELVERLFDAGVAVIGFDILFSETEEPLAGLDPALAERVRGVLADAGGVASGDARLAAAFGRGPVVLSYTLEKNPENTDRIGALPAPALDVRGFRDNPIRFIETFGYSGNLESLQAAAAGGGHISNPLVDEDGVFRRVPMLQRLGNGLYESLSLAMARAALGGPLRPGLVATSGRYPSLEWLGVGKRRIPVDANVATLIPFRGPHLRGGGAKPYFPYVSATDVLEGQVPKDVQLAGRAVLVGTTAPGLMDLRSTPMQNIYPGVEIHANLLSGILDQRFKQRPAYVLGAEAMLLLLVGLAMGLGLPLLGVLGGAVVSLGLAVGLVALNLLAWNHLNLVLPLAPPLLLISLLFALNMTYGFLVESRGKRFLGTLFGQYVPPELVNEMSADPQNYRASLEGERREMSVLFSDVRGFTGISEGLDPRELTELMNAFLTPMTRVIHKHRGTIDKYMGDAIMAFWGAPLEDPANARHAVQAALDMERVITRLSEEFIQRGWPPIAIGIGINTGIMNVGNMGSAFRMAYTVLGDAVNLGSRLEGLTKQYGVTTIVSEFTREKTSGVVFRELDRVRVKGRDEPVVIYEPLCREAEAGDMLYRELDLYREALRVYRKQDWPQARQQFSDLEKNYPQRRLYPIYLERIVYFRANPPGPDWDGVFSFTTK